MRSSEETKLGCGEPEVVAVCSSDHGPEHSMRVGCQRLAAVGLLMGNVRLAHGKMVIQMQWVVQNEADQ